MSVPFLGAAIGYIIHYMHVFMHEAAHYNLDPDRRRNDLLANVAVGALVGMSIKPYRPTHFNHHHNNIGTPLDTEISYFDPLNLRFIVESLVGIKVLKAVVNRNKVAVGSVDKDHPMLSHWLSNPLFVAFAAFDFARMPSRRRHRRSQFSSAPRTEGHLTHPKPLECSACAALS